MEKEDIYMIQTLINEYGAKVTLAGFRQALRNSADEYSDMGLKERARETIEIAELLGDVHDVIE